jgi:hypothetical protein
MMLKNRESEQRGSWLDMGRVWLSNWVRLIPHNLISLREQRTGVCVWPPLRFIVLRAVVADDQRWKSETAGIPATLREVNSNLKCPVSICSIL